MAGDVFVSEELAYALITPYSLYKSRTGGIIARLLAYAKLDLVAARMYSFSDEFIDRYSQIICPPDCEPAIAEAWRRHLDGSFRRTNPWGYIPRCMLLLFRGEDAVRHLRRDVIGPFTEQPVGGCDPFPAGVDRQSVEQIVQDVIRGLRAPGGR